MFKDLTPRSLAVGWAKFRQERGRGGKAGAGARTHGMYTTGSKKRMGVLRRRAAVLAAGMSLVSTGKVAGSLPAVFPLLI